MNNVNRYGQAAGQGSDIGFKVLCKKIDKNEQDIPGAIKEWENRFILISQHEK